MVAVLFAIEGKVPSTPAARLGSIQFIDFEHQLRREQQQHGCGCTIRRLHDKPETMVSTGTLCLVFDMCGMVARAALSMFVCLFPNSLSGPPTEET